MKFIYVTMTNNSTPICVNADRIECLMALDSGGTRILFPYLSQDGDVCHMNVEETLANILGQIPS